MHPAKSGHAAEVRIHQGRAALIIDGEPISPLWYALTQSVGGRWSWEEQPRHNLRRFAEQGVRLFQVPVWLYGDEGDAEALPPLDQARGQIRGVRAVCPEGLVVLRVMTKPSHAWHLAHREECVVYADTPTDDRGPTGLYTHDPLQPREWPRDGQAALRHSLASRVWLDDAVRRLRELCRGLAACEEGTSLVGVHVAGGGTHEWHQWGFMKHEPDTSRPMTERFRAWLRAHYADDQALRAAWGDERASLAAATVPGAAARNAHLIGIFQDPIRGRRIGDYLRAQHDCLAGVVETLCATVKADWPRPIVTGIFYGYVFWQFGRVAMGGHLELERILASPHIDYLSGPMSYSQAVRGPGGAIHARSVTGACRRAGKLWMDEMDQSADLAGFGHREVSDRPTALAMLRRNIVYHVTRGSGAWFYDFGPRCTSGWWDRPDLLAEVGRVVALSRERDLAAYATPADVLVVYDLGVFYHLATDWHRDCVSHVAIDDTAADLRRAGVAVDDCLLSQLPDIDLAPYRVVIFANTFVMTAEQRRWIRDHVCRDGRSVLWNHLPAYGDGHRLAIDHVRELTGFELELWTDPDRRASVVTDPAYPDFRRELWHPVPVPVCTDAHADLDIVGRFEASERPAIVRRRAADHTAWLFSLPLGGPGLLRRICAEAGAHVYNEVNDALAVGGGLIAIHSAVAGRRRIRLRGGREVALDLPAIGTTVIGADSGTILLDG